MVQDRSLESAQPGVGTGGGTQVVGPTQKGSVLHRLQVKAIEMRSLAQEPWRRRETLPECNVRVWGRSERVHDPRAIT